MGGERDRRVSANMRGVVARMSRRLRQPERSPTFSAKRRRDVAERCTLERCRSSRRRDNASRRLSIQQRARCVAKRSRVHSKPQIRPCNGEYDNAAYYIVMFGRRVDDAATAAHDTYMSRVQQYNEKKPAVHVTDKKRRRRRRRAYSNSTTRSFYDARR